MELLMNYDKCNRQEIMMQKVIRQNLNKVSNRTYKIKPANKYLDDFLKTGFGVGIFLLVKDFLKNNNMKHTEAMLIVESGTQNIEDYRYDGLVIQKMITNAQPHSCTEALVQMLKWDQATVERGCNRDKYKDFLDKLIKFLDMDYHFITKKLGDGWNKNSDLYCGDNKNVFSFKLKDDQKDDLEVFFGFPRNTLKSIVVDMLPEMIVLNPTESVREAYNSCGSIVKQWKKPISTCGQGKSKQTPAKTCQLGKSQRPTCPLTSKIPQYKKSSLKIGPTIVGSKAYYPESCANRRPANLCGRPVPSKPGCQMREGTKCRRSKIPHCTVKRNDCNVTKVLTPVDEAPEILSPDLRQVVENVLNSKSNKCKVVNRELDKINRMMGASRKTNIEIQVSYTVDEHTPNEEVIFDVLNGTILIEPSAVNLQVPSALASVSDANLVIKIKKDANKLRKCRRSLSSTNKTVLVNIPAQMEYDGKRKSVSPRRNSSTC